MNHSTNLNAIESLKEEWGVHNLTDETLQDFMKIFREHLEKTALLNKTSANSTNVTLNGTNSHLSDCLEYCDSNMRKIFDDYKQIHGYVSLAVSIFGTLI